mmetsp:Transcript_5578/g.11659  ORF Transcript_5578/g.11659 Transcript_5578/m.11659 type:complete len:204 (+) Transcript_5578:1647-2258(+)
MMMTAHSSGCSQSNWTSATAGWKPRIALQPPTATPPPWRRSGRCLALSSTISEGMSLATSLTRSVTGTMTLWGMRGGRRAWSQTMDRRGGEYQPMERAFHAASRTHSHRTSTSVRSRSQPLARLGASRLNLHTARQTSSLLASPRSLQGVPSRLCTPGQGASSRQRSARWRQSTSRAPMPRPRPTASTSVSSRTPRTRIRCSP